MKRSNLILSIVSATAVVTSVSGSAEAVLAFQTYMRVARHVNVTFISASTHDAKFSDATNAIVADSGSNDVACDLALARHDSWSFTGSGSTDVIDNQTEYEDTQFNATDAYLNVVNTVNWCQTTGAYGGCGWPIGNFDPFIVTRNLAVSAQGGIVYAHEFGHVVGLNHDNLGQQIMDPDVLTTSDTRIKSSSVCNLFRHAFPPDCKTDTAGDDSCVCSPFQGFTMQASSRHVPAAKGQQAMLDGHGTDYSEIPIEQLALGFIVDQMPVEVEDFYGQEDVDTLVDMLQDPANDGYARTIITLIGLISYGTDGDVLSVADYSELPASDFSAAMMALGTIASRTGNELALTLLAEQFSSEEPSRARAAALGLGLSGDPLAFRMLTDRATSEKDISRRLTFLQAAKENGRVAQSGLRQYYLQSHGAVPQRNRTLAGGQAWKE